MPNQKIRDHSNDRNYFLQIPQIILQLCRNPQDIAVWIVIKLVAGENQECFLATYDLAILASMSSGKVSDSRKFLLAIGAIEGELRKDPGYPQSVWHLRTPDIWAENINWRKSIPSLKERLRQKKYITKAYKNLGIFRQFQGVDSSELTKLCMTVKSLHNMKPSQYEEGVTQNVDKEEPIEEPIEEEEEKHLDNQGTNIVLVDLDDEGYEIPHQFNKRDPFFRAVVGNLFGFPPFNLQGANRKAWMDHIQRQAREDRDWAHWCLWVAQNNGRKKPFGTYISFVVSQKPGTTFEDWQAGRMKTLEDWLEDQPGVTRLSPASKLNGNTNKEEEELEQYLKERTEEVSKPIDF